MYGDKGLMTFREWSDSSRLKGVRLRLTMVGSE